jgi:TM2 domain-containing membrane protein YozV
MLIYGVLFGVGKLLLGETAPAVALLAMGGIGMLIIYVNLSRRGWNVVVE